MATDKTNTDSTHDRGHGRARTLVAGTLWLNGVAREIRIRNISDGGMMFDCAQSLPVGARVSVRSAKTGLIEGSVAWAEGNRYGVQFGHEIKVVLEPPPRATAPARTPKFEHKRPGLRLFTSAEAAKPDDWR